MPVAAAQLAATGLEKSDANLHKSDTDAMANSKAKRVKHASGSGTISINKARAKVTQKLHKSDAGAMAHSKTKRVKHASGSGTIGGNIARAKK